MHIPEENRPLPSSALPTGTDLLLRPAAAFRTSCADPLTTVLIRYGLLFLATLALLATGAWLRHRPVLGTYPVLAVEPYVMYYDISFAGFVVLFTAGLLISCLIIHALVLAAGGRAGIQKTLAVLLYAALPVLLAYWVLFFLTLIPAFPGTGYLFLLFAGWSAALGVIGIREVHGISTARAVLPFLVFIPAVACCWILVAILFAPHVCGGAGPC